MLPPAPTWLASGLKAIRESLNLSMREVEERSGINKSTISRLETGQLSNPTWRVMRAFNDVYHIDSDWWFR